LRSNQSGSSADHGRETDKTGWTVDADAFGETVFIVFDTELTGLDFGHDSIVSLGALRMEGRSILPGRTFYRLVKPQSALKPESVVIHSITHDDLTHACEAQSAFKEFLEFAGEACLLGHCVRIDLHFLKKALKRTGLEIGPNPVIDTAALHQWLHENDSLFAAHHQGMTRKTDLVSLAKAYGVPAAGAHNALQDAAITAQLFQRFLPFLVKDGIRTMAALLRIGKPL
jgi:DNA polymerase-3 subunit epsilon